MATLWGGRFTTETSQIIKDFNDSLPFDKRLLAVDIEGSKAQAAQLLKIGIIDEAEEEQIQKALSQILSDVESEKLIVEGYEDVHSFVEANLIDRIGDAGKKLHTGRSRNDQVALDMKKYTLDYALHVMASLKALLKELLTIMEENQDTIMPGFTHLQKAQPTVLAHHIGAYFEMFYRDYSRIADMRARGLMYSPLGSGALCGSTFSLDREFTAERMGFLEPCENSMDGVSDRDYLLEFLSDLSIIQMHLSRFCEEIIIWNSDEYKFIELSDAVTTGSSLMPQKKNPDIAELIRGKTGRVYAAQTALLTTMKGLPLAYNKDMQEDKELSFDAFDTVLFSLNVFAEMIRDAKFNKDRMRASAKNGFTNATDVADYLVGKGVPFRDAHGVVGSIVLYCIDKGIAIDECPLDKLREFSNAIDEDIYEAISLEEVIKRRVTKGSPGPKAVATEVKNARKRLAAL